MISATGLCIDPVLLQQANIFVRFGQIVGTGQSDNTAADYQNIAVFPIEFPNLWPQGLHAANQARCLDAPYENVTGVSTQSRRVGAVRDHI